MTGNKGEKFNTACDYFCTSALCFLFIISVLTPKPQGHLKRNIMHLTKIHTVLNRSELLFQSDEAPTRWGNGEHVSNALFVHDTSSTKDITSRN